MSPEQAGGNSSLTSRSDQFSLGIVLFELATQQHPFQRKTAAETMAAIIREEYPPLPQSVPAPLRWVIERLLASGKNSLTGADDGADANLSTREKENGEVPSIKADAAAIYRLRLSERLVNESS
jgi:serine/threonine protein kinase